MCGFALLFAYCYGSQEKQRINGNAQRARLSFWDHAQCSFKEANNFTRACTKVLSVPSSLLQTEVLKLQL